MSYELSFRSTNDHTFLMAVRSVQEGKDDSHLVSRRILQGWARGPDAELDKREEEAAEEERSGVAALCRCLHSSLSKKKHKALKGLELCLWDLWR